MSKKFLLIPFLLLFLFLSPSFVCADSIELKDDILVSWGVTVTDNDSHALDSKYRKEDIKQCYEDYKANPNNMVKNKKWSFVKTAPIGESTRKGPR